jgi:hypothetical protein
MRSTASKVRAERRREVSEPKFKILDRVAMTGTVVEVNIRDPRLPYRVVIDGAHQIPSVWMSEFELRHLPPDASWLANDQSVPKDEIEVQEAARRAAAEILADAFFGVENPKGGAK